MVHDAIQHRGRAAIDAQHAEPEPAAREKACRRLGVEVDQPVVGEHAGLAARAPACLVQREQGIERRGERPRVGGE